MLKAICKKWRHAYRLAQQIRYKVVAIDADTHLVTVYCRGRGATFKQPLQQLVEDEYILDHMPISHLAWLGYCLSKQGSGGGVHYLSKKPGGSEELRLLQWHRQGLLTYLDTASNETSTTPAYALIQSNRIIRFCRVEAFYIGIQAGIYHPSAKQNSSRVSVSSPSLVMIQGGQA